VFFAALVVPGGLPGPFLRFSGGPVGGLVVQRFLLLTWVHCLSSAAAAWAEAGAGWVEAGVGAGAGTRIEAGTGAGAGTGARAARTGTGPWPGTANRISLSLYACFAIVVRFACTRHSLSQNQWVP
jgi:hypothetical protein